MEQNYIISNACGHVPKHSSLMIIRLLLLASLSAATFLDRRVLKRLPPDEQVTTVSEYLGNLHGILLFNCSSSPFFRDLRMRFPRGIKRAFLNYLKRNESKMSGIADSGIDFSTVVGEEQERFLECITIDADIPDDGDNPDALDDDVMRERRRTKKNRRGGRDQAYSKLLRCARKSELELARANLQQLSATDGEYDKEIKYFETALQMLRDIHDFEIAGIPWPWLSDKGWTWYWILPLALLIVLIIALIAVAIWWFFIRTKKGYEFGEKVDERDAKKSSTLEF